MRGNNDFYIGNILQSDEVIGFGKITGKKVAESRDKQTIRTIFSTKNDRIVIQKFGEIAIKITVNEEKISKALTVNQDSVKIRELNEKYTLLFPEEGEYFNVKILRGKKDILGSYATSEQLEFLDMGPELYEMFSYDSEKKNTVISFKIPTEYGIYGLGENFTTLNKRGRVIYTFPHDNYCLRGDDLYKGVPFFTTNAGFGIVFPHYFPIKFDFGSTLDGLIRMTVPAESFSFYILLGEFREIIDTYCSIFGAPNMPPEWSFGLWVSRWAGIGYQSLDEVSDMLDKFSKEKIPMDVVSMDPQWLEDYVPGVTQACSFKWDHNKFRSDNTLGKFLHERGKKLCLWINPYVNLNAENREEILTCLLKDKDGKIAKVPNQDKKPNKPPRGMFDFTRAECRDIYSNLVADLLNRSAADAVMSDFGETVPPEALDSEGNVGYLIRNKVGDLYQISAFEGVKYSKGNGIVWGRSGSIISHNCPIQWGGDSNSTWEGMKTAFRGLLSASMSGTFFSSFDTGGFAGKPDTDLYIRWAQLGSLMSHFKIHGNTPREPWFFGEDATNLFAKAVRFRYSLLPFLIKDFRSCINSRLPLVRPLVFDYPHDPVLRDLDSEFILGTSIIVAPIMNPSSTVKIYLPNGEWLDFKTKETHMGPIWIEKKLSLEEVPIYVKKGTSIPVYSGDMSNVEDTLQKPLNCIDF